MRRFEKRSTHAPMDFEYEKERDLGPWSLAQDALQNRQAPFPSQPHPFGAVPQAPPAGPPNLPQPSSIFASPAPATSFSFNHARLPPQDPIQASEQDLNDISMSTAGSETPSPRKVNTQRRSSSRSPERRLRRRPSGSISSRRNSPNPSRRSVEDTNYRNSQEQRLEGTQEKDGRRRGLTKRRSQETEDSDNDNGAIQRRQGDGQPQTTSNFYTLQLPKQSLAPGELPYILTGYAQFLLNLSLVLVILYLIVQFLWTIKLDVDEKVAEYSSELLHEIAICSRLYLANKCDGERIPMAEAGCSNWERCMNKDPKIVGRAKVFAETMSEVVNGFVDPLTWKTLFFTITTLVFGIVALNVALSLYRAKLVPQIQHSHAQQQQQLLHAPHAPSIYGQPYSFIPENSLPPPNFTREGSQFRSPALGWPADRSWSQGPESSKTSRKRSKQP